MQNVLPSLALVLVFGLFSATAYGQVCAGQTAPDSTGVTPEELPLITDADPDGSAEVTFRFPSNGEVVFDLGALTGVPGIEVAASRFNTSLQFDGADAVLVTDGGSLAPTPSANGSASVVSTNAPGNDTWEIPETSTDDYIGCATIEYSATADGSYDVSLRPSLDGFLVLKSIPAIPIPGFNLPFEEGDTIVYDSISPQLQAIPNPIGGGSILTPEQSDSLAGLVTRPAPGDMQTRFVKNAPSGVVELAKAMNFQVFPNPVTVSSAVRYTLENNADVSITLTDVNGRAITEIFSGNQTAGTYEHALCADCGDLAPGLYFVHVVSNQQQFSQRVVVR